MLLTAMLAGVWILAFGIFGLLTPRKKTLTRQPGQADKDWDDAQKALKEKEDRRLRLRKPIATVGMMIGGLALLIVGGLQIAVTRNSLLSFWREVLNQVEQFDLFHWVTVAAYLMPALYMIAVLLASKGTKGNEPSRTNYLDAMKTLTAASGLTVGIISATLKQDGLSPDWIATVRSAAVALAVCIACSVTTLFSLSILYDITRTKDASGSGGSVTPVETWQLALFVVPFAYFALVKFFLGFAFLVHLTYLAKSSP